MDPVPESRLPWREGRRWSTGLLLVAFVGVLILWLQVRPEPQPSSPPATTLAPAVVVTDTVSH